MKRLLRCSAGTSMIEFAIVAPVFIFMLIGLIEIGRYEYYSILAANGARAGVQYGAQNTSTAVDTTGIKNAVLQDAGNLSNWTTGTGAGITVNYLCSTNGGTPTTCGAGAGSGTNIYYVQVQVTGLFKSLLNYPGIRNSLLISGSSIMRVASQ